MTETTACPLCEGEIGLAASKCRHCGEWVSRDCLACGTPIRSQWAARGYCADCEGGGRPGFPLSPVPGGVQAPAHFGFRKNRSISVGLALVFGGVGAHKFYLERPGAGFLHLAFCWTGIPTIVGIFQAVKYIRMEDEEFHRRFYAGDL